MLQWSQMPTEWLCWYNGVNVQLSLTMQQESGSKRLVFGTWVSHDGVEYIECCYSIDIGVFLHFWDGRSFFLDRFDLTHRSAWERATIGCCCTFSSYMSGIATVKAKFVIESSLAFFWGEASASSAAASEPSTTSVCRIYFDNTGGFFDFPNVGVLWA